ncbi:hypothetical protein SPBR_02030 [Sporothrix brasiliensis 5110]|uniref:Nudix hydrolase domain-containing protein n=1 Tax=Sporothrix brasiliensis 5110 TaxID=1398154 RepID=A0A0C2EWR1_9PEZI|nr:uncharacterized protein SPBR_02030 [Sporothrix brasiliensis 5110]KIH91009.1 hypothetical protein SPBR_02030 [Sporothrix brasiliensis 5110]
MAPPPPPPEVFQYTIDPSLEEFNVTPKAWIEANKKHFHGIAVSNVVFDDQDRVLLVQRAAHDSMPNRWEVTGGAADEPGDDKFEPVDGAHPRNTILSGAARELWEEAGLVATRFTHLVPQPAEAPLRDATEAPPPYFKDHAGYVYTNRTGTVLYLRFAFHVLVQSTDKVTLDPDEHQDYVWATEEEVRNGMTAAYRDIPATVPATRAYILEAFRLRRQAKEQKL